MRQTVVCVSLVYRNSYISFSYATKSQKEYFLLATFTTYHRASYQSWWDHLKRWLGSTALSELLINWRFESQILVISDYLLCYHLSFRTIAPIFTIIYSCINRSLISEKNLKIWNPVYKPILRLLNNRTIRHSFK